MARYNFTGRDKQGAEVNGVMEAVSREAVLERLGERLSVVTSVREETGARQGQAKEGELAIFTHELAATINAGVALPDGLSMIYKGARANPGLQRVVNAMLVDVRAGKKLSAAMAEHGMFPSSYVAAMHGAEATGSLGPTLERLGRFIELNEELRREVSGALAYPALVTVFAVAVSMFVVTFTINQLSGVYADMGLQLPLLTRMLIWFGQFVTQDWIALIVGISLLAFGIRRGMRTPTARRAIESLLFRIPTTSAIVHDLIATNFTNALSTLTAAGVNLAESLELTAGAVGFKAAQDQIIYAHKRILEGADLETSMQGCTVLNEMLRGMIIVGAATDSLPETLERASRHYEQRFKLGMKNLLTLLEPTLMMGVGALVGMVVIALFLPFMTLTSALTKGG